MNTPAFVIVVQRGQLSVKDKERLSKCGVIYIEADDPSSVRLLTLEVPPITANCMTKAAISALASQSCETNSGAITTAGKAQAAFVAALAKAVQP